MIFESKSSHLSSFSTGLALNYYCLVVVGIVVVVEEQDYLVVVDGELLTLVLLDYL